MTPTQRIIVDVLNIIKSNVFLPYEKNLIAGVDVIPEISVPYLLERLDLNRVELEDTLSKLHAKGFILDFRFESRSGTIPEGVTVVPPNDFLRRYDDYLDKNYTAITVDVANKKVCIGEQIVSLTKGKQVEIMAEIFSMNEREVSYSELSDRPKKNTITSIRVHFEKMGILVFESVGNKKVIINSVYLNRFKP